MNNKGADQTVRKCRLICAFVVRIWQNRFSHDMARIIISSNQEQHCHRQRKWMIWATSWQNQQNGMCTQRRHRSPSLIRVFAVRMKKAQVLSYPLNAQRRLIRLGSFQADLSLRWVHSHFVGFDMRQLKSLFNTHDGQWWEFFMGTCIFFHFKKIPNLMQFQWDNNMSLITRKPIFGFSDQGRLQLACSATVAS